MLGELLLRAYFEDRAGITSILSNPLSNQGKESNKMLDELDKRDGMDLRIDPVCLPF
jgi:hypothetical protein